MESSLTQSLMNCSHVSAHRGRRSSILLKVQSEGFRGSDINATCGHILFLTKQSVKRFSDSFLGTVLSMTGATVLDFPHQVFFPLGGTQNTQWKMT